MKTSIPKETNIHKRGEARRNVGLFASRPHTQGEHQTEISTPDTQNPTLGGAQRARQVCLSSKQTCRACDTEGGNAHL
jgi:hypothetical protein